MLVEGDADALPGNGVLTLADGSQLYRSGSQRLIALKNPSALVQFQSGTIGIRLGADVRSRGLLGNHDGDAANDLVTASGEQLAADAAPHVLYGRYADSWRITSAQSKFTYAAGQDTATFTDASFPSQVTTLADFSTVELDAASDTCCANHVSEGPAFDDCVYDLVSTGHDQYVKAAAAVSDTVVDPSQPSFNDDGELVEDFGPPVASAFAYSLLSRRPVDVAGGGPRLRR